MKPKWFVTGISTLILFSSLVVGEPQENLLGDPPVIAPFSNLDTYSINDWWNRDKNEIIDLKVPRDEVIAFALYTVSNKTLKLSAQLFPLFPKETRKIRLEIYKNNTWQEIQDIKINDIGWSGLFRIDNWESDKDIPYRIRHSNSAFFEGLIRKDPKNNDVIKIAGLSCNSNKDRGMRPHYIRNINYHDPDIIFFAGDQSYDHKEHTAAWLKFGLQFRDIMRNRPTITIPDDHDIGQGNIWGEDGKKASSPAGNDGGYFYHPEYVKMVERCQTSHLPDPYDPTPILRGIGVYYTSLIVGEVDFAIIEDRKFKSGPKGKIPQQGPRPDHIINPEYDPSSIDVPGLSLLGERQLTFLNEWGENWTGVKMKAVLSQTGFCGGAHLHGPEQTRLHADLDSNGWPQTGRKKALEIIKKANAVHIAGDQHLPTIIRHGINEFRDGPWAFVVPAIVNNYYSRWWKPEDEEAGMNHKPSNPLPWTGDYYDGFNNKISMYAYANPDSPSNGAGYGLVKFDKLNNTVTFECWPRHSNVQEKNSQQFLGWPKTIKIGE
jgi:hypothetical protein